MLLGNRFLLNALSYILETKPDLPLSATTIMLCEHSHLVSSQRHCHFYFVREKNSHKHNIWHSLKFTEVHIRMVTIL